MYPIPVTLMLCLTCPINMRYSILTQLIPSLCSYPLATFVTYHTLQDKTIAENSAKSRQELIDYTDFPQQ